MATETPFTLEGSNRQSPTVDDDATLLVGSGIDTSAPGVLTIGATNATSAIMACDIEFQGVTTFPGPVEPLNLPLEFSIDSVPTTVDVTAANLNELTGAGVTALHSHAGVPLQFEIDAVATSTNVTAANLSALAAGTFAGMIQKRELVIGEADLVDAATFQVLNLGATLPANAQIVGVSVALATPFSGGGATSVDLSVGTVGDTDAIVGAADLFAAAVDGAASSIVDGIAPRKRFVAAGTQLLATVVSDVNVDTLTAGSATVTVLFVSI